MASIPEEIERLQALMRANPEAAKQEVVHVVYTDRIAKERRGNPKSDKPKTKFIWETHSAHLYTLLHIEKDRIVRRVGNLSIAYDLMLRTWQELDDAKIRTWLSEGE